MARAPGRPTIYEVAEHAGVSISTVSNVLNRPRRVAAESRRRVLEAIDALGYIPRSEAVSRARRGLARVGVVAAFTAYPSFEVRLRGVFQALRDEPFELVVYDQESLAVRQNYLASLPISNRLDGLIIMSLPFDETVAERLLARELPTVLVEFARPEFDSVTIDDRKGGSLAGAYLAARGHRRLAFIGEGQASEWIVTQSINRLEGFRDALRDHGIDLDEKAVALGEPGVEGGEKAIERLLSLDDPPTAVFTHNDLQALGVLKGADRLGAQVPGDLSVVGFDGLDFAAAVGLTTVVQPLTESGRVAARMLLERIAHPDASARSVELPLRIAEGRSTAVGKQPGST